MVFQLLKKSDVVVGLFLLAFGGIATFLALQISQGPAMRTLPPNVVPLICAIGIGVCGLGLLIKGFVTASSPLPALFDRRQLTVMVLFGIFFFTFEQFDYRLSIGVFTLVVMFVLGCRSWKQLLLVPIGTVFCVWLLFQQLFKVFLPTWI